jgi:hypothetical protein
MFHAFKRRHVTLLSMTLVFACSICGFTGCGKRVAPVTTSVPLMMTMPFPTGASDSPRDRFGKLFCGVLGHLPESTAWGFCSRYFSPASAGVPVPDVIPGTEKYRFLVVPGIFGQCIEATASPFEDAARHMRSAHGVDVEYLSVSALGSTAYNARQIREYLDRHFNSADSRRYIAFGYSKGASDLLEAIAEYPVAKEAVAAIVTIAGTVLGSRLADGVPPRVFDLFKQSRMGTCDIGDGGAVESLRRVHRVAAMARFTPPARLRSYSIAAVSDLATTSAVLLDGWQTLQSYSLEQDSQVIHEDAIVPGATYLGMAKGDHWAIALPFEDLPPTDPMAGVLAKLVTRNHYPRTALFEAAVRYVVTDLP